MESGDGDSEVVCRRCCSEPAEHNSVTHGLVTASDPADWTDSNDMGRRAGTNRQRVNDAEPRAQGAEQEATGHDVPGSGLRPSSALPLPQHC